MRHKCPLLLISGFIASVTFFKVGTPDFWWHVQAGELFWNNGWIDTEPFAHTRLGEPYLATQSWLADIIFFLIFNSTGATGIIIFRILIAIGIALFLLQIDKKKLYPNVFLVCLLAVALLPSMKDRPQLWTFLLFAGSFLAVINKKFIVLIIIQLLWANLHGGAPLIAFGLLGAAFIQDLYEEKKIDWKYIYAGCGMIVAFLATPNFLHNADYVRLLFTDQTKQFIKEWSASDPSLYIRETGLFWILAIGSLYWSRQKIVFSGLSLLVFGYLSITAGRHIPLFLILCIGIVILQLKEKDSPIKETISHTVVLTVLLILFYLPFRNALSSLDQLGLGTYEPYASAYEFIEEQNLQGNMFNTYSMGGYLLFRGHPNRKVFVDGRNVDYGHDFLRKTFDSKRDVEAWNELEQEYDLTYAIIETNNRHIVDELPEWHLVYIDEYATVYAKGISDHKDIIDKHVYTILTPENFLEMTVFQEVEQSDAIALEQELLRQARQAPESITSLLLLAEMYKASNLPNDSAAMLQEADARR